MVENIEFSQKETILTAKFDVSEIESLNDLANLFFKVGKAVGIPLRKITLTKERKRCKL